jgi:hypothetical protein
MEESKFKSLKPKIKLRELRAIQKGEISFKKSLGQSSTKKGSFPETNERDQKKAIFYELLFKKKE